MGGIEHLTAFETTPDNEVSISIVANQVPDVVLLEFVLWLAAAV